MDGDREALLFGARLRQARLAAAMSQEELAERSGLSVRTIQNIERGRTGRPYPQTRRQLVNALSAGVGASLPGLDEHDGSAAPNGFGEALPAGGPVVPRLLPAKVRHFVGRIREQQVLDSLLDEANTGGAVVISAIGGTPGIGKTALAVYWAHRVSGRFPDGQLYVNLRGYDPSGVPLPAAAAVRRFLEALTGPSARLPIEPDAQYDLYRSMLAGRRMLIVLDNARDAEQVRPLLPGTPGCLVVVTSRDRLAGLVALDGAVPITLDLLAPDEARELLGCRLGAHRVTGDVSAADELAEACARLPLALNIAAGRAMAHPAVPLATLADELRDVRGRLDLLSAGEITAEVRAVFSWSYRSLQPDAARLFRLLGLQPGPDISAPAAASVAGVPTVRCRELLAILGQAGLVTDDGRGRFGLHDLLRAYAAEQAAIQDSDADRRRAIQRMLDHYLNTAAAAGRLQDSDVLPTDPPPPAPQVVPERITTRPQALDWLATEYRVLLRLVDLALDEGFDVHCWQLARALRRCLEWRAAWPDWDRTHQAAAQAASRLGDRRAQALTLISWSRCEVYQGRSQQAEQHLQVALAKFEQLGDRAGQARVLTNLGVAARAAHRYEQAITWARSAYDVYVETGERDGQAGCLANIGLYHLRLDDPEGACGILEQALRISTDTGNPYGQALAANNLGLAYRGLHEFGKAIEAHARAARLIEDLGDQADLAEVLGELAAALRADGQVAEAVQTYQRALQILTELRHPEAPAMRARLAEVTRDDRGECG
jgi:tetratricopeptide (TPR) repeat protein/transcriptional regulator with XRE-family HTH domain